MLPVRIQKPQSLPVTLAEAKKHLLAADFDDDDTLITAYLEAATTKIERELDMALVTQTWRQVFSGFSPAMLLSIRPARSVSKVEYYDPSGAKLTIDPDQCGLFAVAGASIVVPNSGNTWPQSADRFDAVTIEYVAGDDVSDVPADLKTAIILHAASLYKNREGEVKSGNDQNDPYLSLILPYRKPKV